MYGVLVGVSLTVFAACSVEGIQTRSSKPTGGGGGRKFRTAQDKEGNVMIEIIENKFLSIIN